MLALFRRSYGGSALVTFAVRTRSILVVAMVTPLTQRIRLRFRKAGPARFFSHHDIMRLFERAVRMAEIPIRMTSGFNPHPRISFPLALGLGVEGQSEVAELELAEWLSAEEVRKRLAARMPEGMEIVSAKIIPPRAKSMVSDIVYEIDAPEGETFWNQRIEKILAQPEIIVERKKKDATRLVDLRPFLLDLGFKGGIISIRLKVMREGTARVDELLYALLGGQAESAIHRRVVRSQVTLIDDAELAKRRMGQ
ncbi:MAG: TIGR03936 family radical SAM-associated protein [Planctomycetota bacterium]